MSSGRRLIVGGDREQGRDVMLCRGRGSTFSASHRKTTLETVAYPLLLTKAITEI